MRKGKVLSAIFVCGFSVLLMSQSVPGLISYQGRLTNSSGVPLDGVTVDLTFAFYGVESGATPLYLTVLQEEVVVSSGIYNVLIGSGTITPGTENTLADVFQKHSDVWMGVKAGSDNEMTPRSRISSAPYALKVDSRWWTEFYNKSDFDGDGYPKVVDGATATTDCNDGDASVNPGASEVCDDGIDNDCNGYVDGNDAACIPEPFFVTWTWMEGSNTVGQAGVYGSKGVAHTDNIPGSRYLSTYSKDASGNFWLFGGDGLDSTGASGWLNDLWKYDGADWTWVSGSNTVDQQGVYGTQGVADPSNIPGARFGAVSWTDASGNFWIFGGAGLDSTGSAGYLNDLWKFDGANWTWMEGDDTGNVIGIYSAGGKPGSRYRASAWKDSSNNFWLFGGYGLGESIMDGFGTLNDMWKFDGADWTFMGGSTEVNPIGEPSFPGMMYVFSPSYWPKTRYSSASWTDGSGNLWLYGGLNFASLSFNDLWVYNTTLSQWAVMGGTSAFDQNGIYGTKGTPNSSNEPGSRYGAVAWVDGSDNLWIFGGYGYGASGGAGYLNDLWEFNSTTYDFTWMSGSDTIDQPGVYGVKGTGDPLNVPGSRYGAAAWTDASYNFWIFGGGGFDSAGSTGRLNDLWRGNE